MLLLDSRKLRKRFKPKMNIIMCSLEMKNFIFRLKFNCGKYVTCGREFRYGFL